VAGPYPLAPAGSRACGRWVPRLGGWRGRGHADTAGRGAAVARDLGLDVEHRIRRPLHQPRLDAVGGTPDAPFIIAEATVRYLRPATIGIPLDIEVATSEVRNKAWVWRYRILDARDDSPIAEGQTVQVMYDYAAGSSVEIPSDVRAGLARV
jgi:acyl-CoA thioesterase FadM